MFVPGATPTIEAPLGEKRAIQSAGGGLAATTTLQAVALVANGPAADEFGEFGAKWLQLAAHNLGTSATVVRYHINPWLTILKTTDDHQSFIDYSFVAQDNDAATSVVLSSIDTLVNGDALFVGSPRPIRGVIIDVDGTNSTGSRTLTVEYPRVHSLLWTSISVSDGTSSSTAFDQDGSVTWTLPTYTDGTGRPGVNAWARLTLNDVLTKVEGGRAGYAVIREREFDYPLYWSRWTWNGALDSSVTLDSMLALNRSQAYPEIPVNMSISETVPEVGTIGGIGAVEFLTDTGTMDLVGTIATLTGGEFHGGPGVRTLQ